MRPQVETGATGEYNLRVQWNYMPLWNHWVLWDHWPRANRFNVNEIHVSVRTTDSNQIAWLNGTNMTKETNDVMIPQFTSKVVVAMVQNLMGFSTLIKPIG